MKQYPYPLLSGPRRQNRRESSGMTFKEILERIKLLEEMLKFLSRKPPASGPSR
jgi:hypothetical protein